MFSAAGAARFRLEGSCFTAAGFTRLFFWPGPSAAQAFCVSGELPATGGREVARRVQVSVDL